MMTRTYQVIGNVALALEVGTQPKIFKIEGYINGAANTQYWLQIHNSAFAALSSGVSIPLRSLQVIGTDGYTFNFQPTGLTCANLPGVLAATINQNWIIVLSSTDAVYTAVAGGVTCDINCDVEEFELELAGMTTVTGNTLAGVLQIVADGATFTGNLVYLEATNSSGFDEYLQIYCQGSLTIGVSLPVRQWFIPNGTTLKLNFGSVGSAFHSEDADGTIHNGIVAAASLTGGAFNTSGALVGIVARTK